MKVWESTKKSPLEASAGNAPLGGLGSANAAGPRTVRGETCCVQMIVVAPVTSYRGQPWALDSPELYPRLPAGSANLPRESVVLLDQIQGLDARRVLRVVGELRVEEYATIRSSVHRMLG